MSEIACSQQLGVFVVHLSACFGRLGFYIFSLVFLSTFPVVIPFLVIKDVNSALHVWQLVSLAMLYLSGYGFGRYAPAFFLGRAE